MTNNIRILVADDDMSIRGVVTSVLTDEGYQVTGTESGEQALELFLQTPYPIVITDIVMGGMTGIDLLKKVKEINNDTQVIIMTSNASLETAIEALRAGAYDYLFKPFDDIDSISMVTKRAAEKIHLVMENKVLLEGLKQKNEELEDINEALSGIVSRSEGPDATEDAAQFDSKAPATTIHKKIELIRKQAEKVRSDMRNLIKQKK